MSADVARIFRAEYGRAVAVLTRHLGDLSLAEEAVQDAFVTALDRWPRAFQEERVAGVPNVGLRDAACHVRHSLFGALFRTIISHDNGRLSI